MLQWVQNPCMVRFPGRMQSGFEREQQATGHNFGMTLLMIAA